MESSDSNHLIDRLFSFVRIDHPKVKDVANLLQAKCKRIPMKIESFKEQAAS